MTKPNYHSPKDYLDAAKSSQTPLDELARLATSEYDFVRLAVARNPRTTSAILRLLLPADLHGWNNQEIASEIARNGKTPRATLEKLAEKLIPYLDNGRGNEMAVEAAVRLCNNAGAPLRIIEMILSPDIPTGIRSRIATRTIRVDILRELTSDPSEAVCRKALNNLKKREQGVR
ncbi:MAG TPA: hypothetical protein VL572_08025 [Pyrinomonadaceae bacterium]|nr:hypothetical protein [Pyrinomonadaceae bacterium]